MIVTELLKTDLQSVLQDPDIHTSLLMRMRMAKDVALGMNWLHSNKPVILHRDLTPGNLLCAENLHVKISDYGLARIKSADGYDHMEAENSSAGTPYWIAPEALAGQPYSEKSDVYSFAIVLWQLVTKAEPYGEENFADFGAFARAVVQGHLRPKIPSDTLQSLRELISDCWEANPIHRPPFASIVKRIDVAIIDSAIRDPHANIFWKERFLGLEDCKWKELINLFCEYIGLTTPGSLPILDLLALNHHRVKDTTIPLDIRCFKAVLLESSDRPAGESLDDELVRLERFGQVLDWFGPLKSPMSILEKVRNVLRCGWFHGDITTQEAENRLITKDVGTFLVRFSTSAPGAFTISKVSPNKSIHHLRIAKGRDEGTGDFFQVQSHRFPSLIELINGVRELLLLLIPCTGSRFFSLFHVQQGDSGYIDGENNASTVEMSDA